MTTRIRPATRERLPDLAHVFGRAFADDPMLRWPLPDLDDLEDRIERTFGMIYEGIIDDGVIWEAGEGDGFAIWIPPGNTEAMFESDASVRDRLAPLTDDGGARYDVLWAWIEARVPDDVWYLDGLGVEPAKQGKGIGSALIRHGLEHARRDGNAAFLETAIERNVDYYGRFGFRVIDEGAPAPGGPHLWFMQADG